MVLLSCSDKDDKEDLNNLSNAELNRRGWNAFQRRDFSSAENHFSVMARRNNAKALGHYGLGWTALRRFQLNNAKEEFNRFIVAYNDLIANTVSDSVFRDVRAGQTIVHSSLGEHNQAITVSSWFSGSSNEVNNWQFTHDSSIDANDIRLFRAMSQYALGQFPASLTTVRLIDPSFEADVSTVEGRLLLMRRMEELARM